MRFGSGSAPSDRVLTVTVGGLPGTGTTTLCRLLERELGLAYVYAGQIFRQEAAARGVSLADLNVLAQRDPSVDRALDDKQEELLRAGGVILEGRLSGWLAATAGIEAVKVWVRCAEEERIRRLVERDGGSEAQQRADTRARVAQEADRYQRYYGADLDDLSIYDLVLDSTDEHPAGLCRRVVAAADPSS